VGEHAVAVGQERGAVAPDGLAEALVLAMDGARLFEERGGDG
jgi:hypothetical protein